jgi:hypothetical protein
MRTYNKKYLSLLLFTILLNTNLYSNSFTLDEKTIYDLENKLPICGMPYTNCLLACEEFQNDEKVFEKCDEDCEKIYRKCIDKELED